MSYKCRHASKDSKPSIRSLFAYKVARHAKQNEKFKTSTYYTLIASFATLTMCILCFVTSTWAYFSDDVGSTFELTSTGWDGVTTMSTSQKFGKGVNHVISFNVADEESSNETANVENLNNTLALNTMPYRNLSNNGTGTYYYSKMTAFAYDDNDNLISKTIYYINYELLKGDAVEVVLNVASPYDFKLEIEHFKASLPDGLYSVGDEVYQPKETIQEAGLDESTELIDVNVILLDMTKSYGTEQYNLVMFDGVCQDVLYKENKAYDGWYDLTTNSFVDEDEVDYDLDHQYALYSDGKIFKGFDMNGTLKYSDGEDTSNFTGWYYKGEFDNEDKIENGSYYVAGVKYTGIVDDCLFVDGKEFTGYYELTNCYYIDGDLVDKLLEEDILDDDDKVVVASGWYVEGKPATGNHDDVYYVEGKPFTGFVGPYLFKDGTIFTGLYEEDEKFYVNGALANGTYEDKVYENGVEIEVTQTEENTEEVTGENTESNTNEDNAGDNTNNPDVSNETDSGANSTEETPVDNGSNIEETPTTDNTPV